MVIARSLEWILVNADNTALCRIKQYLLDTNIVYDITMDIREDIPSGHKSITVHYCETELDWDKAKILINRFRQWCSDGSVDLRHIEDLDKQGPWDNEPLYLDSLRPY